MHTVTRHLFVACLLISGSVDDMQDSFAAPPPLRYDHYHPPALQAFALRKAQEGDIGSAILLLKRAAYLAPHDESIRHDLERMQSIRSGKPLPVPVTGVASEPLQAPSEPDELTLPPFPLWQNKTSP